jgi:hypothetical protein
VLASDNVYLYRNLAEHKPSATFSEADYPDYPSVLVSNGSDAPDAALLLAGDPEVDEQSLVLARLRYLSAHEVGHTLGLMHNFAATTFGWGSVMDYLAPNVQLRPNGTLDLSNAYPTDVGSYDRLMIRWGYTPSADPTALDPKDPHFEPRAKAGRSAS